jgi:hypothetical protein
VNEKFFSSFSSLPCPFENPKIVPRRRLARKAHTEAGRRGEAGEEELAFTSFSPSPRLHVNLPARLPAIHEPRRRLQIFGISAKRDSEQKKQKNFRTALRALGAVPGRRCKTDEVFCALFYKKAPLAC